MTDRQTDRDPSYDRETETYLISFFNYGGEGIYNVKLQI